MWYSTSICVVQFLQRNWNTVKHLVLLLPLPFGAIWWQLLQSVWYVPGAVLGVSNWKWRDTVWFLKDDNLAGVMSPEQTESLDYNERRTWEGESDDIMEEGHISWGIRKDRKGERHSQSGKCGGHRGMNVLAVCRYGRSQFTSHPCAN